MTIDEMFNELENKVRDTYIVTLKYKYDFEKNYTIENQILEYDSMDDNYVWLNDWNEGQTDIEVLGYMLLGDVDTIKIKEIRNAYKEGYDEGYDRGYITGEAQADAWLVIEDHINDTLDKIRAEITDCLKALDEIEKSGFNIYLPNEISGRRLTYQQCLRFIDKYKAESEE